jgi:methyltransferase (TIGR00027 family)
MLEKDMAAVMAAIRLKEMQKSNPLYEDKYARLFATPESFRELDTLVKSIPYFEEMLSVRHRLFIEFSEKLLKKRHLGITQIVSLGAGYCSMVDALMKTIGVRGFEVDQLAVCNRKKDILGNEYQPTIIPLELNAAFDPADLITFGFSNSQKTLFILEGVLYYFPNVNSLTLFLDTLSNFLATTDSYLLFDMQVGENSLTEIQKETTKNVGINDCFLPLSFWTQQFEQKGLEITFFSKIALADRWNRLDELGVNTKSSLFLVHKNIYR